MSLSCFNVSTTDFSQQINKEINIKTGEMFCLLRLQHAGK